MYTHQKDVPLCKQNSLKMGIHKRCVFPHMPLEIERLGDEIRIRPARPSLEGVLDVFAQFSPDFMTGGRGEHRQSEREAL